MTNRKKATGKIKIHASVTHAQLDYLEKLHSQNSRAVQDLVQYCIKHVPVEDVIFEARLNNE